MPEDNLYSFFHQNRICPLPFTVMNINSDGEVFPCSCANFLIDKKNCSMGNVLEQSFADIWHGAKFSAFRKLIYQNKYSEICQANCPFLIMISTQPECLTFQNVLSEQICLDIEAEHFSLSSPIQELIVQSSSECNLKCLMCRDEYIYESNDQEEQVEEKSLAEALNYIDNIKVFSIGTSGEPFFKKSTINFLQRLSESGKDLSALEFKLISNGTLLGNRNLDLLKKLKAKAINISISLNAASKASYNHIMRGGNWEVLVKNLKRIGAARAEGYISSLNLGFIIMKSNVDDVPNAIKLRDSIGADSIHFKSLHASSICIDEFILKDFNKDELIKLENHINTYGNQSGVYFEHRLGSLHKNDPSPFRFMAQTLMATDREEDAIDLLTRNSKSYPDDHQTYSLLGQAFHKQKKFSQAIKSLNKAIELCNENAEYHLQLAQLYYDIEDLKSSQTIGLKALDYKEDFPDVLFLLCRISMKSNNLESAVSYAEKAIEFDRTNLRYLHYLGNLLIKKRDIQKAELIFNQIIQIAPLSADANYQLGQILFSKGESASKVLSFVNKAIACKADVPEYYLLLAKNLIRVKDLNGAIEACMNTLRLLPENKDAHNLLIQIYFKKFELRNALYIWKKKVLLKR